MFGDKRRRDVASFSYLEIGCVLAFKRKYVYDTFEKKENPSSQQDMHVLVHVSQPFYQVLD